VASLGLLTPDLYAGVFLKDFDGHLCCCTIMTHSSTVEATYSSGNLASVQTSTTKTIHEQHSWYLLPALCMSNTQQNDRQAQQLTWQPGRYLHAYVQSNVQSPAKSTDRMDVPRRHIHAARHKQA
jgi:hypothetical protein